MSEELKQFNINLEDIKENNNLFDNIQKAIDELRIHTLSDRFEVILNNNLLEIKEKMTNYRTILGCRITYDNLDKNVSFIVREDTQPSYEELQNRIDKAIDFLESMDYCGQEDYFCDKKTVDKDPCGNNNSFYDSLERAINILQGKEN